MRISLSGRAAYAANVVHGIPIALSCSWTCVRVTFVDNSCGPERRRFLKNPGKAPIHDQRTDFAFIIGHLI